MADPWLPREEYVALQQEMRSGMAALARLELACVLGAAALFAWLVRGAGDYVGYQGLVWFLPIVVPAYGILKARAVRARLALVADYLAKLEGHASPGEERWQAYLERQHPRARSGLATTAWLLLLAATIAASAFGFADFREQCPGLLRDACLQDAGPDAQTEGA
ncbi:hypothetical protein [Variovorax ginsengisoli]|uniref:Transmembrane protein n=1 Tax=Variovorax ginsengisoli TaxID=363844 RepID=A0ABT8S3J3_9BURK|nr:hypothetical protein [Variovorax ginsengisoli]MDN8613619.1 hypothetical protein [Variovorax ginsengisoli]MDO1532789.1 hypothetical protein [Variovorax ginsengisoli]